LSDLTGTVQDPDILFRSFARKDFFSWTIRLIFLSLVRMWSTIQCLRLSSMGGAGRDTGVVQELHHVFGVTIEQCLVLALVFIEKLVPTFLHDMLLKREMGLHACVNVAQTSLYFGLFVMPGQFLMEPVDIVDQYLCS
jgi:hypothetical protein